MFKHWNRGREGWLAGSVEDVLLYPEDVEIVEPDVRHPFSALVRVIAAAHDGETEDFRHYCISEIQTEDAKIDSYMQLLGRIGDFQRYLAAPSNAGLSAEYSIFLRDGSDKYTFFELWLKLQWEDEQWRIADMQDRLLRPPMHMKIKQSDGTVIRRAI